MRFNKIPILPITENKENAWKNKVANQLNASNLIAGDGIDIDYGPDGTTISAISSDDNWPLMYVGDYDFNAQYYPNQIVRVNLASSFKNQNGLTIPFGNTSLWSSPGTVIPINPALFVCVNYVPPGTCNQTWLQNYIVPQYPQGLPFNVVQGCRFYQANCYYPVWPEIPGQYTSSYTIFDGHSTIVSNNTFWKALPMGAMTFTTCIGPGNTEQTMYVIGAPASGSLVYDTRYLPATINIA